MAKHGSSRLNYDEQNQLNLVRFNKERVFREILELFCFEYAKHVAILA